MAKPFMLSWEVKGCKFYSLCQPRISHQSFYTNLNFLEDDTLMSTSSCGPVKLFQRRL
jgi:DNA-binding PadR family transcriptional regulator